MLTSIMLNICAIYERQEKLNRILTARVLSREAPSNLSSRGHNKLGTTHFNELVNYYFPTSQERELYNDYKFKYFHTIILTKFTLLSGKRSGELSGKPIR